MEKRWNHCHEEVTITRNTIQAERRWNDLATRDFSGASVFLFRRFIRIRHYDILSRCWKRGKLQALQTNLKINDREITPKTFLKNAGAARRET